MRYGSGVFAYTKDNMESGAKLAGMEENEEIDWPIETSVTTQHDLREIVEEETSEELDQFSDDAIIYGTLRIYEDGTAEFIG